MITHVNNVEAIVDHAIQAHSTNVTVHAIQLHIYQTVHVINALNNVSHARHHKYAQHVHKDMY